MLGGTALGTGENWECHPWEARLGAGQAGLGIAWSGKHSSFQSAAGPALGREGEAARSLHRHPRRRCAGFFIWKGWEKNNKGGRKVRQGRRKCLLSAGLGTPQAPRPHRCRPPGGVWEPGCSLAALRALFPPPPPAKIGTICSAGAGRRGGSGGALARAAGHGQRGAAWLGHSRLCPPCAAHGQGEPRGARGRFLPAEEPISMCLPEHPTS